MSGEWINEDILGILGERATENHSLINDSVSSDNPADQRRLYPRDSSEV